MARSSHPSHHNHNHTSTNAVPDPGTEAVITGEMTFTGAKRTWPVEGTTNKGTAISQFWMSDESYSCYTSGGPHRGPAFSAANDGKWSTVCMGNGHYMGINNCYCSNGLGAYLGNDYTGMLYVWVRAPTCADGVKNGEETDVDCGGPQCGPCGKGATCDLDADCAEGFCWAGTCQSDESGLAMRLDAGSGAYVEGTGLDLSSASKEVTVEAWVRPVNPRGDHQVILDATADGANRITLYLEAGTGRLRWDVANSPSIQSSVASADALPPGRWTLVGVVAAGGVASLYMDRALQGAVPAVQPGSGVRTTFLVGRGFGTPPTSGFSGSLDEVRVWSKAIAPADLGTELGSRVGIQLAYSFDTWSDGYVPAAEDSIADDSGAGHTGALRCGDAPCVGPSLRRRGLCGDGFIAPHEGCDDGNNANGDGCSDACEVESGFVCGTTSPFVADVCVAGSVPWSTGFEPDADKVWSVTRADATEGVGGTWEMVEEAARLQQGGLLLGAAAGSGYTWGTSALPTSLAAGSQLEYLVYVPPVGGSAGDSSGAVAAASTASVPFAITVIAAAYSATAQPLQCDTDAACGGHASYTICYNTAREAGCDDVQLVPPGMWIPQRWSLVDAFTSKYGSFTASTPLQVVLSSYGGPDDDVTAHVDALRVVQLTRTPAGAATASGAASGTGNERVVQQCATVHAASGSGVDVSLGMSAAASVESCRTLKVENPGAKSGLYYVHLGQGASNAFRVFCDMETDGGGWTVFWRNLGGYHGGGGVRSNSNLWSSAPNDLVEPPANYRSPSMWNQKLYSHYRDVGNVELLKSMWLYQSSGGSLQRTQKLKMDLGANVKLRNLKETT